MPELHGHFGMYVAGCRCDECVDAYVDRYNAGIPRSSPLDLTDDDLKDAGFAGTAPPDTPLWLTDAHAACDDIESTGVHTRREPDGELATTIRWPCGLVATFQNMGGPVRTERYSHLHDRALAAADEHRRWPL